MTCLTLGGREPKDFLFEVAQGNIEGMRAVFVSARNPAVGSVTREDIWAHGGLLVYPLIGSQWTLESDNANDTAAGTGAQTVEITTLDDTHTEVIETIILNGVTPVSSVSTSLYRPRKIEVKTAGTGNENAGIITLKDSLGNVMSEMLATENISQQCHYTVPAGKTAYCVTILEQINKNEDVDLKYARTDGDNKIFRTVANSSIYQSSNYYPFQVSNSLPEKTDYKVTALSSNALAAPFIFIELIEVDNA